MVKKQVKEVPPETKKAPWNTEEYQRELQRLSGAISQEDAPLVELGAEACYESLKGKMIANVQVSALDVFKEYLENIREKSPIIHSTGADIIVPGAQSDQHIQVPKPGKYHLLLLPVEDK